MDFNKNKPTLIHVGNNNFLNIDRILSVCNLKSASVVRIMQEAKKEGMLLDFTGSLQTKGLVIMDSGVVVRIPIRPSDVQRALLALDEHN
jgi:regulator of extracellular matrix RemA (YlzA/DUF370 family)